MRFFVVEGSRCGLAYKQTIIYVFWLRNTCYVNYNYGVDAVIVISRVFSIAQNVCYLIPKRYYHKLFVILKRGYYLFPARPFICDSSLVDKLFYSMD